MELKLKILSPKIGSEIPLPTYATGGSAGMDLRACLDEPVELPGTADASSGRPNSALIPTGLAIALPGPDYAALIFARSGLAVKHGLALSNGVGLIDSDYRGELKVGLVNLSPEPYTIRPGERIAQLVIVPVAQASLTVVSELDDTARGSGGFGSTGKE